MERRAWRRSNSSNATRSRAPRSACWPTTATFRSIFGGARGTRTRRVLGAPAQTQDASGEDSRNLAAALLGGHGGGVAGRVVEDGRESLGRCWRWHCGLLSGLPTTTFAWRPVCCLAGGCCSSTDYIPAGSSKWRWGPVRTNLLTTGELFTRESESFGGCSRGPVVNVYVQDRDPVSRFRKRERAQGGGDAGTL